MTPPRRRHVCSRFRGGESLTPQIEGEIWHEILKVQEIMGLIAITAVDTTLIFGIGKVNSKLVLLPDVDKVMTSDEAAGVSLFGDRETDWKTEEAACSRVVMEKKQHRGEER